MRPTVLFLPGLLCDARLWRDQILDLSDEVDAVVADVAQDDSVEAIATRALAGLPPRFSVCGLSMGGYVAFAMVRQSPERVDRLCLMDTSARPDTDEQSSTRRELMDMARQHRFRGVTPVLLPRLVHPDRGSDSALVADIVAMADRVGRDGFLRQETAILTRPDCRPDLASITVPTLVISGSHDLLIPPAVTQEIADGIPGARFCIVEHAGHLPPMERPAAVNALLREWLGLDG
ncbi:MAG: alpha/beta fold hydrolase [Acidisphaera sp.]|nr:alpha/beta fold hydrolase [Acidisphaera sp.]